MVDLGTSQRAAQPATAFIAIRTLVDVEALPRVMGLFAQRSLVPIEMRCRQSGGRLYIDVEVERGDHATLEILVSKLNSSVLVERAAMLR